MNSSATFLALHKPGKPFIIPNPWDAGSARILESVGYSALATTSSGFAMTLGRKDYGVTREEVLAHASQIVDAVDIAVSADLENGFGATPEDAAETIRLAAQTGLAGGSIEDSTGDAQNPVFDETLAVERIAAAAEAARVTPNGFVLTARAEEFLYGSADLDGVIRRLQKFADAGADVLFAPGLLDLASVKAVCSAVDKPVNVLALGDLINASLDDFAEAGVTRVSIGGGLAWNAYSGLAEQASRMQQDGNFKILRRDAAAQAMADKALKE